MKLFGPLRPNYFIFTGYLKNGGTEWVGGGSSEPPEPPLDQPLHFNETMSNKMYKLARAPIVDSDPSARPRSLTRVFDGRPLWAVKRPTFLQAEK